MRWYTWCKWNSVRGVHVETSIWIEIVYQVYIAEHGARSEAPITLLHQLLLRYRLINSIGDVPREVERCGNYRKPAMASFGEIQIYVKILKSYRQPNQPLPTRPLLSVTQLLCLGHVTDSTDRSFTMSRGSKVCQTLKSLRCLVHRARWDRKRAKTSLPMLGRL